MKIIDAVFEDFWASKAGADFSAKHQWGEMERQAIREFAEEIEEAVTADRRENGGRSQRLKAKLATLLQSDIGRVQREDAIVNKQGVGSVSLTEKSYRDGVYCATLMRSLVTV